MKIDFISHNIDFSLKNKTILRKRIIYVIHKEWQVKLKNKPHSTSGKYNNGFINFIFCDDDFLLSLNKKHLKHNTLTDILTFDYHSGKGGSFPFQGSGTHRMAGEIFISIPRVVENAKKFGFPFDLELSRVMVHGILHLCGYNDRTPKQKKLMREKEDLYLREYSPDK